MLTLLITGDAEEATNYLNRHAPIGTPIAVVTRERDLNRVDASLIICTGRFWLNEAYDSPTMFALEHAGIKVCYSQPLRRRG